MTFRVEFLARARRELLDAWDWYESKLPGLGDKFKHEVDKKINHISKTSERYKEKKSGFRETSIEVFPYLIIYRINKRKKVVAITSIFHTSRNPGKKFNN